MKSSKCIYKSFLRLTLKDSCFHKYQQFLLHTLDYSNHFRSLYTFHWPFQSNFKLTGATNYPYTISISVWQYNYFLCSDLQILPKASRIKYTLPIIVFRVLSRLTSLYPTLTFHQMYHIPSPWITQDCGRFYESSHTPS